MQLLLFIFFAIFLQEAFSDDRYYCDPALCTKSDGTVLPHIACPGNAPSTCPTDAAEIVMTDYYKNYIVAKHNSYRNTVAGGLVWLPWATQMPLIWWNNELAWIARTNAMRCTYGHDQCRNTYAYLYSGQNIFYSAGKSSDLAHIDAAIDFWWNEYVNCTDQDIYYYGYSTKTIGHFTAMSQDRTNQVGCGAVTYNSDQRYIVCNYSFTNYINSYVYRTGNTASGCKTGRDTTYTNLCSANEAVYASP